MNEEKNTIIGTTNDEAGKNPAGRAYREEQTSNGSYQEKQKESSSIIRSKLRDSGLGYAVFE